MSTPNYLLPEQQCVNIARRRTVSSWIEAITGIPVATSSDYSFRSTLRDGVLLCKVMNHLKPCSVPEVLPFTNDKFSEEEQTRHNIKGFLQAAQAYGLESKSLFCVEDIIEGTWQDRPRVVECLYQLQRKSEQAHYDGMSPDSDTFCRYESYSTDSHRTESVSEYSHGSGGGGGDGVLEPDLDFSKPEAINRLMDQCTTILRDRSHRENTYDVGILKKSFMGKDGSENAMKCLETMLKQVLSGITTAQERRGRRDLEQSDKYIKSLENQIALLQQQPPKKVIDTLGLTDGEVISLKTTADALSQKLVEYQNEKALLENALEEEIRQKGELARRIDGIQSEVQSLDGIRNKYKEVQQENCKLYNMVQDLRGNIRVFCRVRPLGLTGDRAGRCVEVQEDEGTIFVGRGAGAGADREKSFKFDKVFGEKSTQEEVYAECQPLIRSVLDGYNVCIFAYGQTGSGKTHTMSGTNVEEYCGRGINYRALDDLFEIKRKRSDEVDYHISVQMLEIYNENLRDLLFDYSSGNSTPPKLDIKSTQDSGLNVPDAVQYKVACTQDVLDVMSIGQQNRSVGSTAMNARSSRSHSVLTVIVDGFSDVTKDRTHGCLHLVDLAGSERISRSEATGDRLKEAQYINRSLSALGDVMSDLAQKSSHVPFRNSKLTQLLKDSLSGQAKSMMFMHISPESSSQGETLGTLNFGTRVGQITLGQASKNVEKGSTLEAINKLKRQASSKDEKIVELQRVVETDRAVIRKSETEKAALEKQLRSLREELQHSQRSLMSSKSHSRRRINGEDSISERSVGGGSGSTFGSAPMRLSSRKEVRMHSSTSSIASSVATSSSSTSKRLIERLSSKMAREDEEHSKRGSKPSLSSRMMGGEGLSARQALLRGKNIGASKKDSSPSDSPQRPPRGKERSGRTHKKSMSMTSREHDVHENSGTMNPRRAVLKNVDFSTSLESTKKR